MPVILRFFSFHVFLIFVMASCAVRSVYVPAAQNVCLFNDQKKIQATGYLGINTVQLQLATNPVNRMVLGLNSAYGSGLSIYEGYTGFYNYSGTDAKWRYESLFGGGYTDNYYTRYHGLFAALQNKSSDFETISQYTKAFIQPSMGYFSKISIYKLKFSFSFGTRLSYLYFNKYIYREIDADQSIPGGITVYNVNKEYYNKNLFLLEPCITNKVTRKNLSVVLQIMTMIPYSRQIDVSYTKFSPVTLLSWGLQYELVFKKKKVPNP